MNFNKVILVGNLTKDPELRTLPSGTMVTNFSMAVNDRYKKGDENVENVSYFDVVVIGRNAESCNKYLARGKSVLVEGKIQQRRWDAQDGTKRSKIEIKAQSIEFLSSGSGPVTAKQEEVTDEDIPF